VILEFFEEEILQRTGYFLELIWPELQLVLAPECSGVEKISILPRSALWLNHCFRDTETRYLACDLH